MRSTALPAESSETKREMSACRRNPRRARQMKPMRPWSLMRSALGRGREIGARGDIGVAMHFFVKASSQTPCPSPDLSP